MRYFTLLAFMGCLSLVHSHGVILKAEGDKGTSQGFLVEQQIARNCTSISPCQQDSTIIRDAEIKANVVNECGRTELAGNIDVGEQTENELAKNRVTSVTKGSTLAVTIHQVNADGAGPYECDVDETSNSGVLRNLTVSNNVPGTNGLSQAKEKNFVINVALPEDLNCIGASTGNVCTVRCRNNALAGPFGGCFAVQQSDNSGRSNSNQTASDITTAQKLADVLAQVQVNKADLPAAIKANKVAGSSEAEQNAAVIAALTAGGSAATASASASSNSNNRHVRRRALSYIA
ncbi:MAG: hypothetical protein M1834_002399 [Cirrosporium novae-zelandiae]|nr:MAG: hypothetical protein M1834_002399 [Cirrosporium novae-zelandiae]